MKKIFAGIVVAAFMMSLAGFASATEFVSATVNKARTVDGAVELQLKWVSGSAACQWPAAPETTAANIWFTVSSAMGDQSLAVGLTAISLGNKVRVGIETCPGSGANDPNKGGTLSQVGLELN